MLSNPPAATFGPLPSGYHHSSSLRSAQPGLAGYMTTPPNAAVATPTHLQVHHLSAGGGGGRSVAVSQGGSVAPPNVTIAKPIPIPASNPQKVAGFGKGSSSPKVIISTTSHQRGSYTTLSNSAPRGAPTVVKSQPIQSSWAAEPPAVGMGTMPVYASVGGAHGHTLSTKLASTSLESSRDATAYNLVHMSSSTVGGVADMPPHGGGASTLTKMLSAPTACGGRAQKTGGEGPSGKTGGMSERE